MSYTKCYQCDRCGKYILSGEVYKYMVGLNAIFSSGDVCKGHWCEACYNKFVDFLETGGDEA